MTAVTAVTAVIVSILKESKIVMIMKQLAKQQMKDEKLMKSKQKMKDKDDENREKIEVIKS